MIDVLLPAIHARPTGGNVYNRNILAALGKLTPVRRHVEVRRNANLWLVDSLCIDAPVDGAILLAHYLHLVDPDHRDGADARREREHLARYRAVIATSEATRDALGGFPCIVIPPGLDARDRDELARRRRNATPRIVTVANFFPSKGLIEAVDVLESLRDLPWRWHLAGDEALDAAYARAFRERLERSPIADRVRVYGPLPPARVRALYDRSDVFLLLSRFETCSMVTREAMARALPVVAYRTGGLASNLPPGTAHLLAPRGDREAIAATLRQLLGDAGARAIAGRANRAAALRFPTWDESARALFAFLSTIVGPGP